MAKCQNGALEEFYNDLDCEFENDFKIFLSQREVRLEDFTTSCHKNLYKVRVYFEKSVGQKEIGSIYIKYSISVHKNGKKIPISFSHVAFNE